MHFFFSFLNSFSFSFMLLIHLQRSLINLRLYLIAYLTFLTYAEKLSLGVAAKQSSPNVIRL